MAWWAGAGATHTSHQRIENRRPVGRAGPEIPRPTSATSTYCNPSLGAWATGQTPHTRRARDPHKSHRHRLTPPSPTLHSVVGSARTALLPLPSPESEPKRSANKQARRRKEPVGLSKGTGRVLCCSLFVLIAKYRQPGREALHAARNGSCVRTLSWLVHADECDPGGRVCGMHAPRVWVRRALSCGGAGAVWQVHRRATEGSWMGSLLLPTPVGSRMCSLLLPTPSRSPSCAASARAATLRPAPSPAPAPSAGVGRPSSRQLPEPASR